jgi:hypothetical protein
MEGTKQGFSNKERFELASKTGIAFIVNTQNEVDDTVKKFEAFKARMAAKRGDTRTELERIRENRALESICKEIIAELAPIVGPDFQVALEACKSRPHQNRGIGILVTVPHSAVERCEEHFKQTPPKCVGSSKVDIRIEDFETTPFTTFSHERFLNSWLMKRGGTVKDQVQRAELDDDDPAYLLELESGREEWLQKFCSMNPEYPSEKTQQPDSRLLQEESSKKKKMRDE